MEDALLAVSFKLMDFSFPQCWSVKGLITDTLFGMNYQWKLTEPLSVRIRSTVVGSGNAD